MSFGKVLICVLALVALSQAAPKGFKKPEIAPEAPAEGKPATSDLESPDLKASASGYWGGGYYPYSYSSTYWGNGYPVYGGVYGGGYPLYGGYGSGYGYGGYGGGWGGGYGGYGGWW